jgi:hypothetical protein
MMPSEIGLKMPQRGPSALGITCVALALCFAAPPRARACGVPEGSDFVVATFGVGAGISWMVFGIVDLRAAAEGRPLSSRDATAEMLFPGLASLLMGASLVDSRQSGFGVTAVVAGTWFTLHGGYTLIAGGGDRATDVPARAPAALPAHAPHPMPGHFNVALNPDPRSPRATLSVTF